jgi:hypothetical protein
MYKKIQKSIFSYSLTSPVLENYSLQFLTFSNKVNTEEKALLSVSFDLKEQSLSKDILS